jgi:protein-L-isoaspartate(D-aspartate) O-methyltransferase
MHAYALQHSLPALGAGKKRILDVGSGSGYLTTAFAMLNPEATVVGVEHIPQLVQDSIRNVSKHHKELLDSGRVRFIVGDGRMGYPEQARYDVIHVGAASEQVPNTLLEQLGPGGVLIVPVGEFFQNMRIIKKDADGVITEKETLPVRFVPLTDRESQEAY